MKTRRVQQIDIRGQVESLKRKINEIDQGVVRFIALVNERFDRLYWDRLGLQGRTRIRKKAMGVARRKLREGISKMPCKAGVIRKKPALRHRDG